MKALFFGLSILVVTVLVTLWAMQDPGYVLITRPPFSIEMSLAVFVVLAVLTLLLLLVLAIVLMRAAVIPQRLEQWRSTKKLKRAQHALNQGFRALARGEWKDAEHLLMSGVRQSEVPLAHYLAAAYASQQRGDLGKRDSYLKRARNTLEESRLEITLAQARLQHQAGEYDAEIETLMKFDADHPNQGEVLSQLSTAYADKQDWQKLSELLPMVREKHLIPRNQLKEMEEKLKQAQTNPSLTS